MKKDEKEMTLEEEIRKIQREEEQKKMESEMISANRKKLDEFGNVIKGAKILTDEERRAKIAKIKKVKVVCRVCVIIGMIVSFFISLNIGRYLLLGGIMGMGLCGVLTNVHMTTQMKEEAAKEQMEKTKKSYGLGPEDANNIMGDLMNASRMAATQNKKEESTDFEKQGDDGYGYARKE